LVSLLSLTALALPALAPRNDTLATGSAAQLATAHWTDPNGIDHIGITGEDVIVYLEEGVNEHPDLEDCLDPDHHVLVTPPGPRPDLPIGALQTGHGTGVAGVLCGDASLTGQLDPTPSVRGLAPGMRLFANNGLCLTAPCAQWFAHHDIQVFSHQSGAPNNDSHANPIDDAEERGAEPDQDILFVEAVGNDGGDGNGSATEDFLDEDPRILGVAASNADGTEVADVSSRGDKDDPSTWPNITAPGCMYSIRLHPDDLIGGGGFPTLGLGTPGCPDVGPVEGAAYRTLGYTPFTGTSSAAPYISGVAALLFEVHPDLTALDAKYLLTRTADAFLPTPDLDGDSEISPAEFRAQHGYKAGYGLVNATHAVAASHYLLLHPDATVDQAVHCSSTGTTYSGELVLNPTGGAC
jgi:subtilisin family serine protease